MANIDPNVLAYDFMTLAIVRAGFPHTDIQRVVKTHAYQYEYTKMCRVNQLLAYCHPFPICTL